ncbi:hypothetical protein CRE_08497 [Caenorhabditis remanei]|uniref:Uncharacterized protein n=1 Tax=Caenorhabditis remanei TaxID=31234 RepID=E3N6Y1_CAERE|nr:hypothetical protein CRE_08497 [Caenorhabditis remanei]
MNSTHKTPLSYLCAQTVLNYVGFSLRTTLSKKCPGFVTLHKFSPARIQRLSLDKNRIEVDHTIYGVSVIRIRKEGEPSEHVKGMNSKGGWECDLDEYGFAEGERIYSVDDLEKTLARAEMQLEKDLSTANPKAAEAIKKNFNREHRDKSDKIEALKLKAGNLPSAYDQYIRMVVISSKFKIVEYVKYTRKLHKAMEYLMSKIFGHSIMSNKKIIVGDLTIEDGASVYLETISPRINYEDHPLNTITTVGGNYVEFPIVGSADLHVIKGGNFINRSNALRVHFKIDRFHVNDFYNLLEYLKRGNCPIGKHISIIYVYMIFFALRSIPNSVRGTFPGDKNPIRCYTVRHGNPRKEINCFFVRKPLMTELHIKIHPRGFATKY